MSKNTKWIHSLIEKIQIKSFGAIFDANMARGNSSSHEAFVKAVVLTSDEYFGKAIRTRPQVFIQYLEMMKGNALARLYYGKEATGKVRNDCTNAIKSLSGIIRAIKKLENQESGPAAER